jgi:5'-3' exonuclease
VDEPAERLMLLDSAGLYFRAFFGVPDSVQAPDGTPVNAVRGFLDMIATLVTRRRPTRLVACWDDDWRPAFRVAAIPSYKAHRVQQVTADGTVDVEESPPGLDVQVPVIVGVLAAMGIARVGAPGFEADDVMATLAERAGDSGVPCDVVTGDRDLFQVVDDARGVTVLYTGKGVRNLDVVDQARLAEKYDIGSGRQYAALAALRGDPSDGLPGVPGIGDKTAAALLKRSGDLAGLLRALDAGDTAVTGAQTGKLNAARAYLDVAPTVVDVVRDVPLPDVPDALPREPADPQALAALVERWGLATSVDRVHQAIAGVWP